MFEIANSKFMVHTKILMNR